MDIFLKMGRKPLNILDSNSLSSLLSEFGNKPVIFQSESQFQFDLAWRLQEEYDCKVLLEDLSMVITREKGSKQKIYTDIILEHPEYRIAIELKYKTAEIESGDIILLNHGATDLGRFDYLWDVHRVEMLVDSIIVNTEMQTSNVSDISIRKPCDKGFAILLTNEKSYWEKCWQTCGDTIDRQFCIGTNKKDGTGQLFSNTVNWRINKGQYPKTVGGTARGRSIPLKKQYSYQWKDYSILQSGKDTSIFKYLIIETN